MVRKLEEKDRKITMEYLAYEPSINLFALGDIELFGFDKEFQDVWGSFDERGELNGVLLRYNDNFIPYYKEADFDDAEFKKIISAFEDDTMISGKESIINNYVNLLPDKKVKRMYFCELTSKELLKENSADIKTAKVSDAARIQALLETIEEFDRPTTQKEIEERISDKSGRIYYMEDSDGQMMSVSQTTAENSRSAMIVGVATAKAYRNRGLMRVCLSKLCADVLSEGKTLCLFYDNPKAGSVYHKLGFESIDKWVMIQ
ncbi:MAG: GNAT family N-acetyltransferase [Clostridia bacterium]|jgi:uncharacterized protein|nr:GNAT family N-acetyltransferase [Clostridia bacterium]MBT7122073.1 GNAT family N-acetyltransferase [Clostridia bacterium]